MSFGTFFFKFWSEDAFATTLIFNMLYFCHLKRSTCLIKFNSFFCNFDFQYEKNLSYVKFILWDVKSKLQSITNKVCLLLGRIFTGATCLCETRLGIDLKFWKINSIKVNQTLFHCMCLRVFSIAERLKIHTNVTNFAGRLQLRLLYLNIWVILANWLNS